MQYERAIQPRAAKPIQNGARQGRANSQSNRPINMWLRALRSAIISAALSIVLVIIFALILQQQWLDVNSITIINPIIKVIAALIAAYLTVRKCESRCWLWGGISGGLFMVFTFLVFSLLSGSFSFGVGTLTDIAMCVIGGIIVGIVRNLKR